MTTQTHAPQGTCQQPALLLQPQRLLARVLVAFFLFSLLFAAPAQAARLKEIAAIEGVRSNQLTGFGLVVGLDGTGDQTTQMPYTSQGLANYMQQLCPKPFRRIYSTFKFGKINVPFFSQLIDFVSFFHSGVVFPEHKHGIGVFLETGS